jgi:hypothetical protein
MERKTLDSCGKKRKGRDPQAKLRRLDFLPAESKCLERNVTNTLIKLTSLKATKYAETAFTKDVSQR